MKRSCYALTWLFGTLLVSLVTIGAARGQIPPPSPGSKGKGGDEGDCPKPSAAVAFVVTESEVNVGEVVERGWSEGPLGWLPYDDEYRCGLPSENPDAVESATIATLVVQQTLDDAPSGPVGAVSDYPPVDAPVVAVVSDYPVGVGEPTGPGAGVAAAEAIPLETQRVDRKLISGIDLEPLEFRVLGYSSDATERADDAVDVDGAGPGDEASTEARAAAARGSARVLRQWGALLAAAAERAERWADEQLDEGGAAEAADSD